MSKSTVLKYLFFLFFTPFSSKILAQTAYLGNPKALFKPIIDSTDIPKLGLCLSGGGAKGLAHIGLLRLLDSLDIRPDYITGTSMGSIMGALYAMGYTGDEIKKRVLSLDWQKLLSSKFPYKDINIEEKDEFGRYMVELPLHHFKLRLPKGAIEGQALQMFLLQLTYPAWHILDFDSLPIPFRCVAVDAKTGKAVLMKKGNLATALRASMSVPLFFEPVDYQGQELIDGGVVRNFPVKEVMDMGATKVIGSYTGFRVMNGDELTDAVAMVFQSAAFAFTQSTQEDKAACDVLINNELPGLLSSNFKNVKAIVEGGEANARAMLPELEKIAAWQHALRGNTFYQKTKVQNAIPDDSYGERGVLLNKLEISPENSQQETTIRNLMYIEEGTTYQLSDLTNGLSNLYGSLFFDRVSLDILPVQLDSFGNGMSKSHIILKAHESRKQVVKLGLHYDTDDAAGILLNLTLRNKILDNSRFVATADLAERPKAHLNFYQFMGVKGRWRWTFDLLAEQTRQNDFLFIKASEGKLKSRDKYLRQYFQAAWGVQRILGKDALAYLEMRREFDGFRPQNNPLRTSNPPTFSFLESKNKDWNTVTGLQHNTQNAVFFPTEGHVFHIQTRLSFKDYGSFTTYTFNDSTKKGAQKKILTAENQTYLHYFISQQKMIPLSIKWSLGLQAALGAGFSLNQNTGNNKPNILALDNPQAFTIGGIEATLRQQEVAFTGLRRAELAFGQFLKLGISGQYNPIKSLYFTPSINLGKFADSHSQFYQNLLDWELKPDNDPISASQSSKIANILGYGLEIGYNTKLGPLRLAAHSNTYTKTGYAYFSMGFRFF
jgi:NTE family protein